MRFIVVFPLLAFEIYLLARAIREWYLEFTLQEGTFIEARITNCQRRTLKPSWYAYYVTYRFEVDGVYFEREQRVSRRSYLRSYPGGFVSVSYLAHNPKISRLAGDDIDNTQRNMAVLYVLVVGIILVIGLVFALSPSITTNSSE
jgi:hypothetical protein